MGTLSTILAATNDLYARARALRTRLLTVALEESRAAMYSPGVVTAVPSTTLLNVAMAITPSCPSLSFDEKRVRLIEAARSAAPVKGLTHNFYRYPARFSPEFVAAAIELFTCEGDAVLDPFMGGGTTMVEAFARGRHAFGSDINELALFVSKSKTTIVGSRGLGRVGKWFERRLLRSNFRLPSPKHGPTPRNLNGASVRPIRKVCTLMISGLDELPRPAERRFARCAILKTAQWALDNRLASPTLDEFRAQLADNVQRLMVGMWELDALAREHAKAGMSPRLQLASAEDAEAMQRLCSGRLADLVVTSPPYPGVHMLYHRWQIHGRRETDAPYWLSASGDGKGSSYYNFADRKEPTQNKFFQRYGSALRAIRSCMRPEGFLVQLVACRDPENQLSRVLEEIEQAGFSDVQSSEPSTLYWRDVPGRRWHAALKGPISTSREVVLIHQAR